MRHPDTQAWIDQAVERYVGFTHVLRGALIERALDPRGLKPSDLMTWRLDVAGPVSDFFTVELQAQVDALYATAWHVEDEMGWTAPDGAQGALRGEQSVDDEGSALFLHRVYLWDALNAQATRDVNETMRALQVALIEKGRPEGLIFPSFVFTTRNGRQIDSALYVRQMWAMALLGVHNERLIEIAQEQGLTGAYIVKEGEVVEPINFATGGPFRTYGEIRDEVFHPNSMAYLEVDHADA